MKPVNIYILSRVGKASLLKRFERQLSARSYFLQVKEWEVEGIKDVAENLYAVTKSTNELGFYYSFQIPKLGKEFDLLQISDETVLNLELKSGNVSDDKIKAQLLLNRYYLATLGKTVRSYTYISNDKRLVRLTGRDRLVESSWEELAGELHGPSECFSGDAESLFREEEYLISPLTDPDRFLRREYFLTSQQKDIRNKILRNIERGDRWIQGFTGLPGTGKTLLLYDIAMQLSVKQRVCVLHFGSFPEELVKLDRLLKRIDFYHIREEQGFPKLEDYDYICVDEGHRMTEGTLRFLAGYAMEKKTPVVISYDLEDAICAAERVGDVAPKIEALPGYEKFRLTSRIRTNSELSSFVRTLMHSVENGRRSYPSVKVAYAANELETKQILQDYRRGGYVYISEREGQDIRASLATCKEFDRVVMVVDKEYYYDEQWYLRYGTSAAVKDEAMENVQNGQLPLAESPVRTLFHGLSRAKTGLALVVEGNEAVFEEILIILQGMDYKKK